MSNRIAFNYVRVSTDGQAEEGVSLDAQREKGAAFCRVHDFDLRDTLADEGISGCRSDNRPGLQRAIQLCCRHKAVLVVYSISRLARNTRDCIDIAERLRDCGADLVSITERIDTTTAAGRLFFTIIAAFAQMERDQVSERTKMALDHKRSLGQRVGNVPYGWDVAPDGVRLVENPFEQETIACCRALRTGGKTLRAIAKVLNERGVPTKGGGPWLHTTVHGVLGRKPPAAAMAAAAGLPSATST